MSGNAKIVTISGEPYVEPEEPFENDEPDMRLVEALESIVAGAKSGPIKGAVIVTWNAESLGYDQFIYLPDRARPLHLEAAQFLGALTITKQLLASMMLGNSVLEDEEEYEE